MEGYKMKTIKFCNNCDKAVFWSAVESHFCRIQMAGGDCMHFEDASQFCECE